MRSTLTYLRSILSDKDVATVAPTSAATVKKVCSRMNLASADYVVEFGPGTGVFTEQILASLPQDGKLIAIEKNEHLAQRLTEKISDPRLVVIHESAENICAIANQLGITKVDYVVSGIPLTFFTPELKSKIIREVRTLLKPEGKFIIYQALPKPIRKKKKITPYLKEHLKIKSKYPQLLNFPPLEIVEAGVK